MAVVEGELEVRRHKDGRVEILNPTLPQRIRVSLELLVGADPAVVRVEGGQRLVVAGEVVFRAVGWDDVSHALLADLLEDRRGGDS